ncbi:16S rRNA (uracil(1498)-N(3))-methyltransferase [Nitrincola alkalisediminis]|uniref:16S rRNA (uracil(1498)-N(3))-methyltransferase n=1 Tax=Nitrincola alkalisediminis TaxID=1366656 RepID=UPI001877082F|nr:16S rRNA (uracil(1498)-N(3))-methyltransferase [Nitrincola alkalisediminis]
MNLVIIDPLKDAVTSTGVTLRDRRFVHIRDVHQVARGDLLKVGLLNGSIGLASVEHIDQASVSLSWTELTQRSPLPLPVTVILALPRPKMLKRVLQTLSSMGVKDIWLIHSYRVDKSYWSTPILNEASLYEQMLLGLEQSGDTNLPTLHIRKRFKPFVEDELPAMVEGKRAYVAHPYQALTCPASEWLPTVLAIGPEGGFIPYEVEKLNAAGLSSISLGQRILKVETAVPVLLSRLFPVI